LERTLRAKNHGESQKEEKEEEEEMRQQIIISIKL